MPKKARDYRAELARRNAAAQAQGFSSYAQLRRARVKARATNTTPVVPPPRTISPRQQRRNALAQRAGYRNDYARRKQRVSDLKAETLSALWSTKYARSDRARFDPDEYEGDYSRQEYVLSYYNAFVDGPQRYRENRKHGSEALRHWFVDILDNARFDDGDDYDARYRSD